MRKKERKALRRLEKKQAPGDAILPKSPKKAPFVYILLIAALGFIVYANSMEGQFIWDDAYLIKQNIYVKNPAYYPMIFKKDIGAGTGLKSASYRPLQMLTYALNYRMGKLDPRGYHLTNIAFHILAAITLFWFVYAVFDNEILSFLTGVFFVVHPVHTEAVSYISGRADSMSVFFMLLCMICYLRNNPSYYIPAMLCYVLGLLTRESALVLPFLILLYHYAFEKKMDKKGAFLGIVGLSFLYILLRALVIRTDLPSYTCDTTFLQRIPGFFVALATYIKLLLWPFGLHMEYGDRIFGMMHPKAILGLLMLVVIPIYAFKKRKNNKLVFFSVAWFFITLLPSSNIYPINAYMAEHWLYLPSIGFFVILASSTLLLSRPKMIMIAVGLTAFYSVLTVKQNTYWKELLPFYEKTLQYAPDSFRLHNDLGIEHYNRGNLEKAIEHYEKALKFDPDSSGIYSNLGVAYKNLGMVDKSIAAYKKAIELDPGQAEAYNNLGVSYELLGKYDEAVEAYEKAIKLDLNPAEAYSNMGNVYSKKKQHKKAIEFYNKAIKADPQYGNSYNNLGNIYKNMGNYEEAIRLYKKALEFETKPASAVHNNLALAYFLNNEPRLAIKHYDKAGELGHTLNEKFLKDLEPYR
jgi:tetratricopeptide (TPR) repeat protein